MEATKEKAERPYIVKGNLRGEIVKGIQDSKFKKGDRVKFTPFRSKDEKEGEIQRVQHFKTKRGILKEELIIKSEGKNYLKKSTDVVAIP